MRSVLSQLSEFEIIQEYFAPLAKNEFSLGLADDVAKYLVNAGEELVFTKDVCVEGVHFFPEDSPDTISRKALRVNLSDLAAKGAQPIGYMIGLGLPENWDRDWLSRFSRGLHQDQELFSISLFGGDTVRSSNTLFIAITAIGRIKTGTLCKRSTANVGDLVYVTGTIGDSYLGLVIRKNQIVITSESDITYFTNRYLMPEPRMNAISLIQHFANASLDISDGLVADLNHLCVASGVGAEVNIDVVPISSSAQNLIDNSLVNIEKLITGGDDYELLFTVAESEAKRLEKAAEYDKLQITNIGRITDSNEVCILNSEGAKLAILNKGFQHFEKN